jgi:hypothetical protein
MTAITRNLPPFVRDTGISIVGEVLYTLDANICVNLTHSYSLEMLRLTRREPETR